MNIPLRPFLYQSNRFFPVSISGETRAGRSKLVKIKPGIPFSGLSFRDSSWKRPNVGFGRSLLGGFVSMAFSGGNGGFGKSDGDSGKGGEDDEDGNGSNLVGSWSLPEDEWKYGLLFELGKMLRKIIIYRFSGCPLTAEADDLYGLILAFPGITYLIETFFGLLICSFLMGGIISSCMLLMGVVAAALCILATAFCTFAYWYNVRRVTMSSEENVSNPPDNVECCICLSTYEGRPIWRSLPCNHWFHSSCIKSWIQIHPTCPLCKQYAL